MTIPSPQLDDRDFAALMDQAHALADRLCPDWDHRQPGDPGTVLLELFAHLTEVLIYRLNRVPEKVQVELLGLIGVQMLPPAAATTRLRLVRERHRDQPLVVPEGAAVLARNPAADGSPVIFTTMAPVVLAAEQAEAEVLAFHGRLVAAEDLGRGTGTGGLELQLRQAPVIAASQDGDGDLVIGIELASDEPSPDQARVRVHDGLRYHIWQEVASFAGCSPEAPVFLADRQAGRIRFAPVARRRDGGVLAPLAGVPAAGRRILAWYRTGGGLAGNLPAGVLDQWRDPVPDLKVLQTAPARGGREGETLDQALIRGPQELHDLQRIVTARDYELAAVRLGGVARAKALAKATVHPQASPGTVLLLLVPHLGRAMADDFQVQAEDLLAATHDDVLRQVRTALDERRPLGSRLEVQWARTKGVSVMANVVVDRDHDPTLVTAAIRRALNRVINPLPAGGNPGWPFGRTLHASLVYGTIMAQAGVRYIEGPVGLTVDSAPDRQVRALAADPHRPQAFFATAGHQLFRCGNDGDSWEELAAFPGWTLLRVVPHPLQPGVLALLAMADGRHRLHLSGDGGETWSATPVAELAFEIEDLTWEPVRDRLACLLATDGGLFVASPDRPVARILLHDDENDGGYYAVAAAAEASGEVVVAVAAQEGGGVLLSTRGGRPGSFRPVGPSGQAIRCLALQALGGRLLLWGGTAALGEQAGSGAFRLDLADPMAGWAQFARGWSGGSVTAFAFAGTMVFAASHRGGVAQLRQGATENQWVVPPVTCGLPVRPAGDRLRPVAGLAVVPRGEGAFILATGETGVFRSLDGRTFANCSERRTQDRILLPETWLFRSVAHEIAVVDDHGR